MQPPPSISKFGMVCVYMYSDKRMHCHIIKLYIENFFISMYTITERGKGKL